MVRKVTGEKKCCVLKVKKTASTTRTAASPA
jgi:hypothetical protein